MNNNIVEDEKLQGKKFLIDHTISFKTLSSIVDIEEFKNHNFSDIRCFGYLVDTVWYKCYVNLPAIIDSIYNRFDEL